MRISTALHFSLSRLGLLSLLSLSAVAAQAQTAPTWASVTRSNSPTSNDGALARKVVVAPDGSQYVGGPFAGSLTLGTTTVTEGVGDGNFYLAKFNPNGSVAWVRTINEDSGDLDISLAVDATGNLYVSGYFADLVSIGTLSATSAANTTDTFVAKLDPQGQPLWLRTAGVGGGGEAYAGGVGVDASGNVYVSGDFSGSMNFGGGAATQLTSSSNDVFLAKFSPAGAPTWARKGGGASSDYNYDMVTDAAGNSYLTGSLRGAASFGAVVLNATTADDDIYVVKYDASGAPQWAQRTGTAGVDNGSSIAIDAAGAVAVSGYADLTVVNNDFYSTAFLARFSPSGAPLWTRRLTPSVVGEYTGAGVAFDNRGGLYLISNFEGNLTLGSTTLTSTGETSFIARYDAQGNAVWATKPTAASATDQVVFFDVATDANGNAYVGGAALGTVTFGTVTSTGTGVGLILAKLNAGGTINAARAAAATPLAVFPNPASDQATLLLPVGGGRLVISDALGRTVREQALPTAAGRCPVSVAGLAPGLYQLQATLGNGQSARAALTVR